MKESLRAESEMLSIVEGGLEKYKRALKLILEMRIENLYGEQDSDEYPKRGEIWNEAVDECLKIVKEL